LNNRTKLPESYLLMSLIHNPDRLPSLMQTWRDAFEVLRYQLQHDDDLTDSEIDATVERIAAPIIEAIDCTGCGNCCRSLDVYLREDDAQRLAHGIDVAVDDIITRYVDRENMPSHDATHTEWGKFRHSPCAFLRGNRCSVYEHRPFSCRAYPVFTPYFRWLIADTIDGASICPIIFNVLRQMTAEVDTMQQAHAPDTPRSPQP
jgi:hypothetical protein